MLYSDDADECLDLRRPKSPQRLPRPRRLSADESDALLEALLTQRTNLLSDPDVQTVLKKSYSLDDLMSAADESVPVNHSIDRSIN